MRGLRHGFVKPHPDTTRLHPVHNARARPRAGAIGLGDGLIIDNEADLPRIGKGDQVSRRRVGEPVEDPAGFADTADQAHRGTGVLGLGQFPAKNDVGRAI